MRVEESIDPFARLVSDGVATTREEGDEGRGPKGLNGEMRSLMKTALEKMLNTQLQAHLGKKS